MIGVVDGRSCFGLSRHADSNMATRFSLVMYSLQNISKDTLWLTAAQSKGDTWPSTCSPQHLTDLRIIFIISGSPSKKKKSKR